MIGHSLSGVPEKTISTPRLKTAYSSGKRWRSWSVTGFVTTVLVSPIGMISTNSRSSKIGRPSASDLPLSSTASM
jgi:hypothetical protein